MENGWYHSTTRETHSEFLNRTAEVIEWLWSIHSQSDEERGFKTGVILVIHGNLLNLLITSLLTGNHPSSSRRGLVTHCNTGVSHLQLWSWRRQPERYRLCSVQFLNRVDHLMTESHLIAGDAVFNDHWIQEFMVPFEPNVFPTGKKQRMKRRHSYQNNLRNISIAIAFFTISLVISR